MKTQQLNVGDLVAAVRYARDNYIIGMITKFTPAYTSYTVEWFTGEPKENFTLATAQSYRKNFLEYRKKFL